MTLSAHRFAQVNLLNAALLPRREFFSTRSVLRSIAVALLALAGLSWWAVRETDALKRQAVAEAASAAAVQTRLREALGVEGEGIPSPQQVAALEQSLRTKRAAVEGRRAARDALRRGLADDTRGPSAILRMSAMSIPPSAWITEIQANGARIDFAGRTLDPAAIHTWVQKLVGQATLQATPAPLIRIERISLTAVPGAPLGRTEPQRDQQRDPQSFSFVVSAMLTRPLADDDSGAKRP